MPENQKILDAVVGAIDRLSGIATIRTNDTSEYRIFLPSHFGGNTAPYPSVDDKVKIKVGEDRRILSAWK